MLGAELERSTVVVWLVAPPEVGAPFGVAAPRISLDCGIATSSDPDSCARVAGCRQSAAQLACPRTATTTRHRSALGATSFAGRTGIARQPVGENDLLPPL